MDKYLNVIGKMVCQGRKYTLTPANPYHMGGCQSSQTLMGSFNCYKILSANYHFGRSNSLFSSISIFTLTTLTTLTKVYMEPLYSVRVVRDTGQLEKVLNASIYEKWPGHFSAGFRSYELAQYAHCPQ
jgi:hypothetical protein